MLDWDGCTSLKVCDVKALVHHTLAPGIVGQLAQRAGKVLPIRFPDPGRLDRKGKKSAPVMTMTNVNFRYDGSSGKGAAGARR